MGIFFLIVFYLLKYGSLGLTIWGVCTNDIDLALAFLLACTALTLLDWVVYNCVHYYGNEVGFITWDTDALRAIAGFVFAVVIGGGLAFITLGLSVTYTPIWGIAYCGFGIVRKLFFLAISYPSYGYGGDYSYFPSSTSSSYDSDSSGSDWSDSDSSDSSSSSFNAQNCYVGAGKHVDANGWIRNNFGGTPTGERIGSNGFVYSNGSYTGSRYSTSSDGTTTTRYDHNTPTYSTTTSSSGTKIVREYNERGTVVNVGVQRSNGEIKWNK